MKHRKAYIKQHIDNDKWIFLLTDDNKISEWNSIDEAENYLYLNYNEDEREHYMIVTYD